MVSRVSPTPYGDGYEYPHAMWGGPKHVVRTRDGRLLVADAFNDRVRQVDLETSLVSTIAGTGLTTGALGDGGPATSAVLNDPSSLVFLDSPGALYHACVFVSEFGGNRIRVVWPNGTIGTVAGTGSTSYNGPPEGDLATGNARTRTLNQPMGMFWSNHSGHAGCGNLDGCIFFADRGNRRVRKLRLGENLIQNFFGKGNDGYFDCNYNFFTGWARCYSPSEQNRNDGRGGVFATAVAPTGVVILLDGTGLIYDCGQDCNNPRIRRLSLNGNVVDTYAGGGGTTSDGPTFSNFKLVGTNAGAMTLDSAGNVYVVETTGQRIRILATDGKVYTAVGAGGAGFSGDGGLAVAAKISVDPYCALTVDWEGNVWIADTWNNRIRVAQQPNALRAWVFQPTASVSVTASATARPTQSSSTSAVPTSSATASRTASATATAADCSIPGGWCVTVAHTAGQTNGTSGSFGDGQLATSAGLALPQHSIRVPDGRVFIADTANHVVRVMNQLGGIITVFAGTGVAGYLGDGGLATAARLHRPAALAWHPAGSLFIADQGNHVIRRVWPNGTISTIAGNGTAGYNAPTKPLNTWGQVSLDAYFDPQPAEAMMLHSPGQMFWFNGTSLNGTALRPTRGQYTTFAGCTNQDGCLYFADTANHVVRRVFLNSSRVGNFAGDRTSGIVCLPFCAYYTGDGAGTTHQVTLRLPSGIVINDLGEAYIAEQGRLKDGINYPAIRHVNDDNTKTITVYGGEAGSDVTGNDGVLAESVKGSSVRLGGLAIDRKNRVYFVEASSRRVRMFDTSGRVQTVVGMRNTEGNSGDGGRGRAATLRLVSPDDPLRSAGISCDSLDVLHIADTLNNRTRHATPQ